MIEKESENGLKWLEFELLQEFPQLRHGVLLRAGGQSKGAFESLNLGDKVGDEDVAVAENFRRVKEVFSLQDLFLADQVHGCEIRQAQGRAPLPKCDGLSTQKTGEALCIRHADCQAAILFDPAKNALLCLHAGWRGSREEIYASGVEHMKRAYGCSPEDIRVGISPSLGPEHAEFIHYKQELPQNFWEHQKQPNHFDFWQISRLQLEACGILPGHIEIAGLCTYANPDNFFSYRRDKVTGRNGTLAVIVS